MTTNHIKQVLVLDNDECLGAWSFASGLHHVFSTYIPKNTGISIKVCLEILKKRLITYYFSNGGARPGTKDTLKLAQLYKQLGYIDKVIMFTSATNNNEWVEFLKDCLEEFADTKGVYDLVLHKNNTSCSIAPDGSTYKCMNVVLEKLLYSSTDTIVCIVDDKPQNVLGNAIKVKVSPYRHVVDEDIILLMMHELINDLKILCTKSDKFWSIFVENIIGDKGYKHDVLMNTNVFKCPLNQLTDTNLIENCTKMFDCHFSKCRIIY